MIRAKTDWRCYTAGLKDGGRWYELRKARSAALEAGKGQARILLSRSRGNVTLPTPSL